MLSTQGLVWIKAVTSTGDFQKAHIVFPIMRCVCVGNYYTHTYGLVAMTLRQSFRPNLQISKWNTRILTIKFRLSLLWHLIVSIYQLLRMSATLYLPLWMQTIQLSAFFATLMSRILTINQHKNTDNTRWNMIVRICMLIYLLFWSEWAQVIAGHQDTI